MWAYPSGKLYCYGCGDKSSLEWFEEFGSDTVAINGISNRMRRLRHNAQHEWALAREEAWCIEHGLAPPSSFKETEEFELPIPLTIFENDPYADLPFLNDEQG